MHSLSFILVIKVSLEIDGQAMAIHGGVFLSTIDPFVHHERVLQTHTKKHLQALLIFSLSTYMCTVSTRMHQCMHISTAWCVDWLGCFIQRTTMISKPMPYHPSEAKNEYSLSFSSKKPIQSHFLTISSYSFWDCQNFFFDSFIHHMIATLFRHD